MTQEQINLHHTLVKLVVCSQITLELIDELKGTKSYRQDIKFHGNNFASLLEEMLTKVYKNLDTEMEDTYVTIERSLRNFIALPIEELYQLGETDERKL
jgi:uncharacterized membrane-anchored protein YhcB (DUF1043 family)